MITIELSDEEKEALVKVLQSYISDLRMEIADTDRASFREQLKKEKGYLESILDKLAKDEKD